MYSRTRGKVSRWLFFAPFLAALAIILVLIGTSLYFGGFPAYGEPFHFFWFGWSFFLFFPLIFLFFFSFRFFFWRPWGCGWYADSSIETLRQRFARGELSKEQFEQMMSDLQK